jgi:hypothetical protein
MCGNLEGGSMSVCGYGDHHSHPIDWTPMVDVQSGFYNIHTVDMAVNGTRLNIESHVYNDGMSTVDSGTTGVYIPDKAIKGILKVMDEKYCKNGIELKGVCGEKEHNTVFAGGCFKMTAEELARYPNIEVIAGKENPITIVMTPQSYLISGFCNHADQYSSNIISGGATSCLFGDSVMLANQVVYDKENQRLGFSLKENCNYQ